MIDFRIVSPLSLSLSLRLATFVYSDPKSVTFRTFYNSKYRHIVHVLLESFKLYKLVGK